MVAGDDECIFGVGRLVDELAQPHVLVRFDLGDNALVGPMGRPGVKLLGRGALDADTICLRTGKQLGDAFVAKGGIARIDELDGNACVKCFRESVSPLEVLTLHS